MSHSQEEARRVILQLSKLRENKTCFDCCLRKSSCVNLFTVTFVCSFCGGLLRQMGHIIKKITTADFNSQEVELFQAGGNMKAIPIWRNISPAEFGPLMLEFQDASGTREHLKEKYIRKQWFKSPVPVVAPVEKAKAKIQPQFISATTSTSLPPPRESSKKALLLSNNANDDVIFVKAQPRRKAEFPETKGDLFGFSDEFSHMYIKHTSPQTGTDMPLQAVSYSFDAFVPKIDDKVSKIRQRGKAAAFESQQFTPFPLAQRQYPPLLPQQPNDFLNTPNYIPELPDQELLGTTPVGLPSPISHSVSQYHPHSTNTCNSEATHYADHSINTYNSEATHYAAHSSSHDISASDDFY